jgi:hypothetical protein
MNNLVTGFIATSNSDVMVMSLSENWINGGSRKLQLAFIVYFRRHKVCDYKYSDRVHNMTALN